TGFSFLWAAAQWLYPYFKPLGPGVPGVDWKAMLPINLLVTGIVLSLGTVALISGLRHRYPKYCAFLGHTRFSNYFMIAIFPIQSQYLHWSWHRLVAIILFAIPIWLVVHLGVKLLRRAMD